MNGAIRKTARFELHRDSLDNWTIRRFSDGRQVFVSDFRVRQYMGMLGPLIGAPDDAFDRMMTTDMEEAL
jgi:hypothetical protein